MNKLIITLAIATIALFGVGCGSDTAIGPQTDITKDSVDVVDTNDTTTNPIINPVDTTPEYCVVGDEVVPCNPNDSIEDVIEDTTQIDDLTAPEWGTQEFFLWCMDAKHSTTQACKDQNGDGVVDEEDIGT